MSERTERWIAEYTPHGELKVRSFVVDYSTDNQFILNAAAWLREMWGNDGVIIVRHQKYEHMGWVEDWSEEYEFGSGNTRTPYSVDNVTDNSAVLGKQETSRKAALATYPRTGTQRWRILQTLATEVVRGMTREELEHRLGLGGNSVHPRVLELIEGKWVYETTDRRRTRAGNDAVVLRITRKGLDEAHSQGDLAA